MGMQVLLKGFYNTEIYGLVKTRVLKGLENIESRKRFSK